jgi:hypothetical protein
MKKLLFLCCVIALVSCKRTPELNMISVGERIHHDDFEYSVSNYMVTNYLKHGTDTLHANGMFYIVNFKVENRALRVNHVWSTSIGFIIDGAGGKYENIPEDQEFFAKMHPFAFHDRFTTPAGASDSTYLVFDLPLTVTKPCFLVRGETLMGDMFDRGKFRRTLIKLF